MTKELNPKTTPSSPSQPSSPGGHSRWSILDSVAQQLDSRKDAATARPISADEVSREGNGGMAAMSSHHNPLPTSGLHLNKAPEPVSVIQPQPQQPGTTPPSLILRRFSAPEVAPDQSVSTPLKDLLRRIAQ